MSQLADVLEARSQELLQRWGRAVREHLAPGSPSPVELEAPLALFLQRLQRALRGQAPVDHEQGARRSRWGVELGGRVRAYGLLRDLVWELIEQEDIPVSLSEARRWTDVVALAVAEAVEEMDGAGSQAEDERARLNALFTQAPMAIAVIRGPELVVEVANPSMLRIWGRSAEEAVGRLLWDVLPELKDQAFDGLLRGVLATGTPFVATEMEVRIARGAGGTLETGYFNFVYQPLRDARGRIDAVLTLATEVSEMVLARQLTENLLVRSQQAERARGALLDALADQSLVGVGYQRGPELAFETANSVYQRLVGREVVGQPVERALPELDGQGFLTRMRQVFETGAPDVGREVSTTLSPAPGERPRERLLDFAHQPVCASDGHIDGILTLVLDVTEQVRLRQEAQRLEAEQRRRNDFEQYLIGIVSHDLRGPLSTILLGLQVLLRRELDAPTLEALVRLRSNTERAVRMVRDLLDFTQARLGGGLRISREPMDVHALVRGVVEEHALTHPERELLLEQRGDGRGAWDADRLAQLVGNLLGNALKYSPPDGPVTVRGVGEDGQVFLEVHNGGTPIAPEALARLFQPLQRAVDGPDPAGRSVGLGLYIVEQIVRAHGGDIRVVSSALEGTTFSVRLPRGP
ncbi:PAS domain-containing sensor histidine kinase [Melittangium boletus]|uniref:sensor histidine kinase n=1 Tax=Melittangium boletus TaxID=83453 RepID=UPI003DA5B1C4